MLVGAGCAPVDRTAAAPVTPAAAEVELAPLMGQMQRHAAKLGHSVDARNAPLTSFYLEEIEEALSELRNVVEHDGLPIGEPAGIILAPLLEPLAEIVAAGDWDRADAGYTALIDGCNRCHAATEHEFIVILEPTGEPDFNQAF